MHLLPLLVTVGFFSAAHARVNHATHRTQPELFSPPHRRAEFHRVLSLPCSQQGADAGATAANPIVAPVAFGADPTGVNDSTAALQAALALMLTRHRNNKTLANGIVDLGGVTMDLQGGDYLMSEPLVIPQMYGNLRIQRGTLRASNTFPKGKFMIVVGAPTCSNPQASCNENLGFSELMLDGNERAAGLFVGATMGCVVGPQNFFLGFVDAGIRVHGGHETMVQQTWLGEYLYSDPRKENGTASTAIGIDIIGNDHFVTNTIVYSAKIGLQIVGAANLAIGLHTWNLATGNGGTGILVNAPGYTQNRFVGCYLDYNDIVLVSPEHVTFVDGFFLGGGQMVVRASKANDRCEGLTVTGNQFDNGGGVPGIVVDNTSGLFTAVVDTIIEGNQFKGYGSRASRANAVLSKSAATEWTFDLSSQLVFGHIQRVSYALQLNDEAAAFVMHAVRRVVGAQVTVASSESTDAQVTVFVDESV